MQSEPHFDVRLRVPPRIDTRLVLRAYANVACVVGITITATGIRGIPGMSHAYSSIIYVSGMAILGAGCAAWGLAMNDDPVSRQRSLRWFGAGHLMLGLIAWMQWAVYWRLQGFPLPVAIAPLVTAIVLLALSIQWPFVAAEEPVAVAEGRIRSRYDEHIRQIARREERARLARDLHDAVKQQLFVIQTAAATAQTRFDEDRDGARAALTHVRAAAREATTEMEALLEELQAAPIENTGLVEALKKQCEALALRTGAEVDFDPGPLPPAGTMGAGAHEAIYRVVQEALANVARHARATRVTVTLQTVGTRFEVRISDNGTGIDASTAGRGMGIGNMETRAEEIGGRVHVLHGTPGTSVLLQVPLADPAVRRAWYWTAGYALLALSNLVFYGIRGDSADRPASWIFLAILGLWVPVALAISYRKAWRRTWQ